MGGAPFEGAGVQLRPYVYDTSFFGRHSREWIGCCAHSHPLNPPYNPLSPQPVSYASLALTLGTGAGLMWYFGQQQEKKVASQTTVGSKVAGAAAIGGPFQLMDQHGKPFSDKNLLGQWSLLYFGFTQCPDICPEELEKIVEAKNLAGSRPGGLARGRAVPAGHVPSPAGCVHHTPVRGCWCLALVLTTLHNALHLATTHAEKATGKSITTVFISVDPERDSVAQVAEYVKEFDPKMIGLTGTLDQACLTQGPLGVGMVDSRLIIGAMADCKGLIQDHVEHD